MSIFSKVAISDPQKSVFNLNHSKKLSAQAGDIIPVFCQYTMPGDKFKINASLFARTLALKAPMMQNVNIDMHFFSVPLRLIWNDWERFISGPQKPNAQGKWDPDPVHPYFTLKQLEKSAIVDNKLWSTGSLADYFGFPVTPKSHKITDNEYLNRDTKTKIDSLPFRAYHLIYREWYRDENLIDENWIPTGSGKEDDANISTFLLSKRSRAWKKDYFTSALPFPQRGEDVLLPLVDANTNNKPTNASVVGTGKLIGKGSTGTLTLPVSGSAVRVDDTGTVDFTLESGKFSADISNLRSSTIIEIRRAFALQKWFENSARLGARYIEQMLAHFGVQSSDARLQRPEFLGGTSIPLVVDSVAQTSESNITPQGTLTGTATAIGGDSLVNYFCEEHCLIIGLLTIRPQNQYVLGIPRQFQMFERFDFPFPEFANIGEQAISKNELFFNPLADNNFQKANTFGYTPRYAEFKYIPSTIHGDFQDTLNYWTMARKFDRSVALNQSFIDIKSASASNKRPFAFQDASQDDYIIQINFDCTAVRPLPYFSNPGYLD